MGGVENLDDRTLTGEQADAAVPLAAWYRVCCVDMPRFEGLSADCLPPPQRGLLDHADDLTPTLAAYYGVSLALRVLDCVVAPPWVERTVTLVKATDGDPVAFGAICIDLRQFTSAAADAVRAGRRPLGALLAEYGIIHGSHPQAFFGMVSDPVVAEALACPRDVTLFGRHNELRGADGAPLARVIEMLPPMRT